MASRRIEPAAIPTPSLDKLYFAKTRRSAASLRLTPSVYCPLPEFPEVWRRARPSCALRHPGTPGRTWPRLLPHWRDAGDTSSCSACSFPRACRWFLATDTEVGIPDYRFFLQTAKMLSIAFGAGELFNMVRPCHEPGVNPR